jgi:hypothetical protein
MFEKLFGNKNAAPKAANDNKPEAPVTEAGDMPFNPETYLAAKAREMLEKNYSVPDKAMVMDIIARLKNSFDTGALARGEASLEDAEPASIDAFLQETLERAVTAATQRPNAFAIVDEKTGSQVGRAATEEEALQRTREASEEERGS